MDLDPTDKWQLVSAALQAAGTFVSLFAAIAAWLAAVASKRAVNEMAAARHQYVKPVLVFQEPENIEINLGVWRDDFGAGYPTYDAKIAIKNVGKGPAFGVEFIWNFEGPKRTAKVPIDVAAINRSLSNSMLEVDEDDRSWEIRMRGNKGFFWNISKSNFFSSTRFDKIEEQEIVFVKIPDDVLALQVLHSLNKMASEADKHGEIPGYAQPDSWRSDEYDRVSVTFRSITDDLHSMFLDAVPRLGMYGDHEKSPFIALIKVSLYPRAASK